MSEHLEKIELRSEEVQEILNKVPHWMIRWGNLLLLLLIVLLFIISWFVKYPDIISSEAIITTEIPPQKEFAKVTGKIDTIFVKDNHKVIKNQSLAIIENTANLNDVFYLKSVIDTIKYTKQLFYYPIDKMPILMI
jgi:multidrug resistance efflux pump